MIILLHVTLDKTHFINYNVVKIPLYFGYVTFTIKDFMESFIGFLAVLFILYLFGAIFFPFAIFSVGIMIWVLQVVLFILVKISHFLYPDDDKKEVSYQ